MSLWVSRGETEEEFAQTKEFLDPDSILRDAYFQVFQTGRHQSGRDVSSGAGSREDHQKCGTSGYGEGTVEAVPDPLCGDGEAEVLLEETKEIGRMEYLLGHDERL